MKKGQLSKQEILQQAIELFSAKGLENVTMRELASYCQLSPGAFYYHFKNKEDLILNYYQLALDGHIQRGEEFLDSAPKNLVKVMTWICHDRFEELSPHKAMLKPLVFNFDSSSPLSPWAEESYMIRKKSVHFFKRVVTHCTSLKDEKLIDILARALWMQHLLIVGLWIVSDDKNNNKGEKLLEESTKVWKWIPTFLKIPGSRKSLTKIVRSLQKIGVWESYENE